MTETASENSSAIRRASLIVERHLPIDHIRHVAPLAEELHHFLARPCHLRPPGFRVRVLFQPSNLVPIEHKIHLSEPTLGSPANRKVPVPSLTALAFSTRVCRQTSMRVWSKESIIAVALSLWFAKQTFDNAEPFPVERLPTHGFTSPTIPVGGVALIALLAVEIRVNPRPLDAFVLLSGFVRSGPIALGIPPQPAEGARESGWRLGRGERLAKFIQGHGAIFSKYADINDDVLLYAKGASPFEAVDKDCRNTNILSRCFATQSRLQSENPSSSSRWLSRGFAQPV